MNEKLYFLRDAEFSNLDDVAIVPVIPGWDWSISSTGRGSLSAPDGTKHCVFDLMAGTIQFEPDGETVTAPGLSADLVQEMGERYANEIVFTPEEQSAYIKQIEIRDDAKKQHNRSVWNSLKGVIQIEHKDGSWLAHVDTDRVRELTGIESDHVLSLQNGYQLFNQMSEKLHAAPLRDPSGYMALSGNVYEFIHTEYRNQYENVLQGIDNMMVDGTGYGVSAVLDKLTPTIRKNVSEFLPEGERFGDLRFVKASDEQKQAMKNFVKCRVSKTLAYEKKRSYEPSALERINTKYEEAGKRLHDTLLPAEAGQMLEA